MKVELVARAVVLSLTLVLLLTRTKKPGEFYTYRLPGLERLNGFWSMVMYPYTTDDDSTSEVVEGSAGCRFVWVLGACSIPAPWRVADGFMAEVVETLRVHIKVWGRAAGDSKNKVITEHTTKETMLCDNVRCSPHSLWWKTRMRSVGGSWRSEESRQ